MNYQFHWSLTWPNSECLSEQNLCWQISMKKGPCPNKSETLLVYKIWLHIMLAPWQLTVSLHGSGSTRSLKGEWQTKYIHTEYRMWEVGINVHCRNKLGNKIRKVWRVNIWRNSFRSGLHLYTIFLHMITKEILLFLSLSFVTTNMVSSNKLGMGDYEELDLL